MAMAPARRQRIVEPSAWVPAELAEDTRWELHLGAAEVEDLLAALARVKARQLPLALIDRDSFPLPRCAPLLDRIRHQLRDGRGFALVHDFPVHGRDQADVERMYWGLCAHLGIGVTQNSDGTLIHSVTEGRQRPNQGTRSVGNPGHVSLHVDLADCVALLCVRQAADSPRSRVASSMTLHNLLLERAPQFLERLYEGFIWDRQNEHGESEMPTTGYRVPMFSEKNGVVSCRYNRNWITKARQREGRPFSAEETAMLDLVDELTHANCLEFDFRPGDIQFANNYTVLHGRAPHAPAAREEETRLLLRIWFHTEGLRPWADESIVRYGVLRHGRLGWKGADVAAGLAGRVHARRPHDLAPLAV